MKIYNSEIDYNHVRIKIRLTDNCNFKCSYCYFNSRFTKNKKFISLKTIKDLVTSLNMSFKNMFFDFYIYGGEPTLHKNFFDILDELNKLECSIIVQTNGSFDFNFLTRIINYKNVKISFSIHTQFLNFKNIFKKIEFCQNHNMLESIDFMLFKNISENDLKIFKILSKIFNCVNIQCVFEDVKDIPENLVAKQEKNIVYNNKEYNINQIAKMKLTNFKGCHCSSGKKHFVISSDGKIYRCDQYHTYQIESLGYVNQQTDFNTLLKNDICKCEICYDYWNIIND